MAIERSGSADLGAAIGDGNLCPFSPKPYESVRLELLASSMAQPPNPNPNPRKRKTKDSSIPPPLSEVAVADEAPTPLVGDESKEKPAAEWRAEPEGKDDVDDDDDLSSYFTTFADGTIVCPDEELECPICGGGHVDGSCGYLTEFPAGGKLRNARDYMIVCDCGLTLTDDGRCSGGNCVSWRPKRVVNKILLERERERIRQRYSKHRSTVK